MRMTTRRSVGWLTWLNPAAAKMLGVPTWISSVVTFRSRIGYASSARAPLERAWSTAARASS